MKDYIFDVHVHAGKFNLLREDIQGLLNKFPFEEETSVKEIFSEPETLKQYLTLNGVRRAIILAECGPGTNFSIDSKLILDFCKNDSFFIPFGSINPRHHKSPMEEWDKDKERGIQGYKFYPADHDFYPFTDDMMAVYEKCAENGQPIMFHTGLTAQKDTEQRHIKPEEYLCLAENFPDLILMFAHGGKPNWYDQALEMAEKYKNVYLDTALVSPEDVAQWLTYSSTIVDKIFFGSDLPVCGAYSNVRERYLNSGIEEQLLEKILHGNAERVFGRIFSEHKQSEPEMA